MVEIQRVHFRRGEQFFFFVKLGDGTNAITYTLGRFNVDSASQSLGVLWIDDDVQRRNERLNVYWRELPAINDLYLSIRIVCVGLRSQISTQLSFK